VLDFVALKEKISVREAAGKLAEWFGVAERDGPTPASEKKKEESAREDDCSPRVTFNPLLTFSLRVDPAHEYGARRGMSKEIISQFGWGLCLSKGMFANRHVISVAQCLRGAGWLCQQIAG
jgi:hypothetical protein